MGPSSNAQSTRMLLPAAVAVATVAFSFVGASDAAAQGFGGRFGVSRGGGGFGASNSMMLPKSGFQKMRPGMVKGGTGKHTGGKVTGPGKIADTGPHPKRPKHPKGKRPKPGILIPGATIPPVIAIVPPTGGGGGGTPPGIGGSGQPPSGNPPGIAGSGATIPSPGQRYVPDEVVIEVAASTSAQALLALARRHRLVRLDALPLQSGGSSLLRWRIPDRRSVSAVVRALGTERVVMAVQPNYLATLQEAPQTVAVGSAAPLEQYSLEKLRLPQAHALATGNKVLIAIIDSGVDTSHPELAGMVADSFDAIGTGERVHPHGTAIAGAIVARARLKGAAPAAQILAIRAFGVNRGSNEGTSFHIVKGLDWALARGARIVNMSFAGDNDPAVARRLAELRARGVVLIAAAGNAGPTSRPLFPAADANVIAVTATDEDDKVFRAANRGRHIAVAAPGVDLMLPAPGGEYTVTSGTSFAAAHVSGAAALMLERNAALDPAAVRQALIATARDLGPKGADPHFGAGLVDAYRAILSVSPGGAGRTEASAAPVAGRQ